MKVTIHEGQRAFINHPVIQDTLNSTIFVPTDDIESLIRWINSVKFRKALYPSFKGKTCTEIKRSTQSNS